MSALGFAKFAAMSCNGGMIADLWNGAYLRRWSTAFSAAEMSGRVDRLCEGCDVLDGCVRDKKGGKMVEVVV